MELGFLQCTQCGGEIELSDDRKVGRCLSCDSEFHYQKEKTAEKIIMLNQANFSRRRNDFEGAILAYQDVLKIDDTDSEAFWGLVLSIYGIEYVADSKNGKNIPTCRRIVGHSIFSDQHYLKAIEFADRAQANVYRQEAYRIDQLQRAIKEKLGDEESYDVFLCYKSTDEYGFPTEDRYIARKIYDELTARGIKAFYSEITLKDKLGTEFEPIIYKALYTSKVMIMIATKEEYIHSVWLRNEWSRFRDRIQDENLSDAAFAVFKDILPAALPPMFRTQGVDLRKYPFGGYEIEIADAMFLRFRRSKAQGAGAMANGLFNKVEEQPPAVKEAAANAGAMGAVAGSEPIIRLHKTGAADVHASAGPVSPDFYQKTQQQNASPGYRMGRDNGRSKYNYRVEPNLPEEEVKKKIDQILHSKNTLTRNKDRALGIYNINRTAMRKFAQQRRQLMTEKEKIDARLKTPDYYKREAGRKSNNFFWLRIFLTVAIVILANVYLNSMFTKVLVVLGGLILTWYRQLRPISRRGLDMAMEKEREKERQLREQIIQCETQLSTVNMRFDKAQKEMTDAEQKLEAYDRELQGIAQKYSYAKEYIEKQQRSVSVKVADAVSDGIRELGNGIDKGIAAVKDMFRSK